MPRISKLNDLQRVLLAGAAQRENGSLLPAPDSIADQGERIAKAIPPLLKRGLVEEGVVRACAEAWRHEEDVGHGLVITATGREAIGAGEEQPDGDLPEAGTASSLTIDPAPVERASTKIATVLALLRSDSGASLADLISATGWLPHTTRAALTGLRKKGHAIVRNKIDGETRYTLAGEPEA